jgi:hypothetical protein
MAPPTEHLKAGDARKTYRYLRIGMIGAVVLLAASILIERSKVDCWQTSISAYYYTPVRAIFVGCMMVVGFSLIVYKGGPLEDFFLNFAGMLAPVVAVAPTMDVGDCWSVEPIPLPVIDGSPAGWVVANINNNFYALLIAGGVGLITAFAVAIMARRIRGPFEIDRGTSLSLAFTGLALLFGWWLIRNWSDFYTLAHGYAAYIMFVFLVLAIIVSAVHHRREQDRLWFQVYAAVAGFMILGGILIPATRVFARHTTFALEAYEIVLFALYWIFQTVENWDEKVVATVPVKAKGLRGRLGILDQEPVEDERMGGHEAHIAGR